MTIFFSHVYLVLDVRSSRRKICGLAAAVAADGWALCHRPVEDMYKMFVVRDMPPCLYW